MNNLTINIDIDNTINDFISKFIEMYNKISNRNLFIYDVTDYDLSKVTGVPRDALVNLFFKNSQFYSMLNPLPWTYDVINKLCLNGHDVRFVTSINYEVIQPRIDFIKNSYPFIDPDKALIVTDNKNSIWADIVIDDLPSHFNNRNSYCKYILFNQPWNFVTNENPNACRYRRCNDWQAINDYLEELQVI